MIYRPVARATNLRGEGINAGGLPSWERGQRILRNFSLSQGACQMMHNYAFVGLCNKTYKNWAVVLVVYWSIIHVYILTVPFLSY